MNEKKQNKVLKWIKKHLTRHVMMGLGGVILVIALILGVSEYQSSQVKTTKIGFENVGELVTQSAYSTVVESTNDVRKLVGIDIPFTQSKYIYSYDVVIDAGYDFTQIEWSENNKTIEVKLPEPMILSNEIDLDSLVVYHEQESIYNQITLEETNQALQELKSTAEQDAINNGLLERARTNAEIILTGFFGNVYDLEEYEIIFTDK